MREYVKKIDELVRARHFNPVLVVEILNGIKQLESVITPEKHDKELIRKVKKEFKSSKSPVDRFIFLLYGSLLEYMLIDKKSAKEEYVSNLVDLNFNYLFIPQLKVLGDIVMISLKLFYDSLSELLYYYGKSVLKGSIWNKTEDEQKLNFLWMSQVFLGAFDTNREFWNIYQRVVDLYKEAVRRGKLEIALTWNFSANHVFMNISQTQDEFKKICDDFDKPLSEFISTKGMQMLNLKPVEREIPKDRPIRVGFVYDRIVFNSPFKVLYSLLKALVENNDGRYEYYVYDIETMEKSQSSPDCIKMLTDIGVHYYSAHHSIAKEELNRGHLYNRTKKCLILREKIINDGIDILIMHNSNFVSTFLFSTRTALKQIYWCHGNFEWDVVGIDKRITHCSIDMKKNDIYFDFFIHKQDDLLFHEDLEFCKNKALEIRKRFGENTIILGSIGRLVKLESMDYLETIAKILKNNENTVYLACGDGESSYIQRKITELGVNDRFFFEGWVDPNIYSHVIDIYLNTFPNPSGESLFEYLRLSHGNVVSYKNSLDEYIKNANQLIELMKKYAGKEMSEISYYVRNKIYTLTGLENLIIVFIALDSDIEKNVLNKLVELDNIFFVNFNKNSSRIYVNMKEYDVTIDLYECLSVADIILFSRTFQDNINLNCFKKDKLLFYLSDEDNYNSVSLKDEFENLLKNNRYSRIFNNDLLDKFLSFFNGLDNNFLKEFYYFEGAKIDRIKLVLEFFSRHRYNLKMFNDGLMKVTDWIHRVRMSFNFTSIIGDL